MSKNKTISTLLIIACIILSVINNTITLIFRRYDRIYVGAACPDEYYDFFKELLSINGYLVMPFHDKVSKCMITLMYRFISKTEKLNSVK